MSSANPEDVMKKKSNSRSVNDFSSAKELRHALTSMKEEGTGAIPSSNKTGVDTVHNVVDSSVKVAPQNTIDEVGNDLGISEKLPMIQPTIRSNKSLRNVNDSHHMIEPMEDEETVAKKAMETELRRLAVLKSYRVIGSDQNNPAYER
ncbi:MAG: hypothetical protein SGILL_009729, partial [Bacillariaceae sp.]